MDIERMDYNPDNEHQPGVAELEILFAPVDEFLTIGEVPTLAGATNFEDAGSISAAHTFDAGKGFTPMNIIPETGGLDNESTGEKGNMTFTGGFSGTIPGVTPKNIGFSRWAKNRPFIFLVPDKDGKYRQVGSRLSPAYFSEIKPTGGKKSGDVNGIPFVVADGQNLPSPFYEQTVTKKTFA